MATLKVTIDATLDGNPIPGWPVTHTATVDEAQLFNYEKAADADATTFSAMPTGEIATVQALLVKAAAAATIRLDAQTDAGIELGIDGVLVILGATINAGATTNVKANNPAVSAAATLKGLAAGT